MEGGGASGGGGGASGGGGNGSDRSNFYRPPRREQNRESYSDSRLPPGGGSGGGGGGSGGGGNGSDRSNFYRPPRREQNRESYSYSRLPLGGDGDRGAGATRRWGSNAASLRRVESNDSALWHSEGSRGGGGREHNAASLRHPEGIVAASWRQKSDEGNSSGSWLRASSRGGDDEGRDARAAANIVPRVGMRSELDSNKIEILFSFKEDILSKPSQDIDLEVYCMNEPMDNFCYEIMQNVHHPNIIHMEAELPDGRILVEAVTGKLDQQFMIARVKDEDNPLDFIRHMVRQMIKGVAELAYCGYYHGNLEDAVPFYTLEKKVAWYPLKDKKQPWKRIVLKLADFKRAVENDSHASQRKDQYSIGKWIENMVNYLKETKVSSLLAELADLGQVLKKALTVMRTPKEWEEIGLSHHFFWGPGKRTSYLTNFVPKLIVESKAFRKEIKKESQLDTPWGGKTIHKGFYGLVAAMDNYRTKTLKVSKYRKNKKKDYVKFACGCYIHEDQIKEKITEGEKCVDAVFRALDVDLVQKLVLIHRRSLSQDPA